MKKKQNQFALQSEEVEIPKTPRERKLQEIFENIGHCQSDLILSRELSEHPIPKDIKAVYDKLEKTRELMRKVK